MKKTNVKTLTVAAMCFAMGILLPVLFHAMGLGSAFLPMHIPVLLCGLLCGWRFGALCGFFVPLLSAVLTGMPPIFPVAPAMMLELCAYGALCGFFYQNKRQNIYLSLMAAMLGGRVVSGVANALLLGFAGRPYGLEAFLTGAFVTALPGIAIQLLLIPVLVLALQRTGLVAKPAAKAAA